MWRLHYFVQYARESLHGMCKQATVLDERRSIKKAKRYRRQRRGKGRTEMRVWDMIGRSNEGNVVCMDGMRYGNDEVCESGCVSPAEGGVDRRHGRLALKQEYVPQGLARREAARAAGRVLSAQRIVAEVDVVRSGAR